MDRSTLWNLLLRFVCPDTLGKISQEVYDGMAGDVSIGESTTGPFEISHGLKQGFILTFCSPAYLHCLQYANTFSSAVELVENYSTWLD